MDFFLDLILTDIDELRKHMHPEQFKQLIELTGQFDISFNDPNTDADTIKKQRDNIITLLRNHYENEEKQIATLGQPLAKNEKKISKLVLSIEDSEQKLMKCESDMRASILKFNEHNEKKVKLSNVDNHYRETQKTYNEIVGLRELSITLETSKLHDQQSLDNMKNLGTSLEKKEIIIRNNMEAISSFTEAFKISYSDEKIQSTRKSKKKKKNSGKEGDLIRNPSDDDDSVDNILMVEDNRNNNNNKDKEEDDNNTTNKKRRLEKPSDELLPPNPQLIGQAVDADQCIYRKDAQTLVKIVPVSTKKILLYQEMSVVDEGFLSIDDTHTENKFPVDRYQLCPDLNKDEAYVLLETSKNIHNLPLDGNRNEKFCIIYELLNTLKVAHDQNGFRYNMKKPNTLKYVIADEARLYADKRMKCTSNKRVIISDLSEATINRNEDKSKEARLNAADIALFENLLRQLYIPNFTHKLIGLLSPTPITSMIIAVDMETKKSMKQKTTKKKKNNITFKEFIDAIGDAWEAQDFLH